MRIIGITGGVGSGKSQVLSFMKERYGCYLSGRASGMEIAGAGMRLL